MVKKKVIVLGVLLLVVGIWGYSSFSQSSTDYEIEKEWELTAKQIEHIKVSKAEQNMKVMVQETDAEKTTVSLSGKVSEQTQEALEKSVITDDKLEMKFSKGGVRLFVTSEGRDELVLTINLAKDAMFKEISFDMFVGNVLIDLPEHFDGKYKLKAEGDGEVLAVPKTTETMDSLIDVKTIGNIKIEK